MYMHPEIDRDQMSPQQAIEILQQGNERFVNNVKRQHDICLLYTSPSPRDATLSRMPSSA